MTGMGVLGVARAALPSAGVLLAALAIVTYVPFLSLALL
jgi:C4-dicarboxylate transporter DctM subunit